MQANAIHSLLLHTVQWTFRAFSPDDLVRIARPDVVVSADSIKRWWLSRWTRSRWNAFLKLTVQTILEGSREGPRVRQGKNRQELTYAAAGRDGSMTSWVSLWRSLTLVAFPLLSQHTRLGKQTRGENTCCILLVLHVPI